MEHKIKFLSLDRKHSEKKQKDYFTISILIDKDSFEFFITEQTYKKIDIKKPQYLHEYNATFNIYKNKNNFASLELFDIN